MEDVRMTVEIGVHKTIDVMRDALQAAGMPLGDYANKILGGVTPVTKPTELDLVVVSNADLGLVNGGTFPQTCERAAKFGLELCPPDVGVELRLKLAGQKRGEWLRIAMKPISDAGDGFRVFTVENFDRGLCLNTYLVGPDSVSDFEARWVFVRRK